MSTDKALTVIGTINDVDIRSTTTNRVRLNDLEVALNIPKKLASVNFIRDEVDTDDAIANGFLEIRKGRFGGTFVRRDHVVSYLEWLEENGFACDQNFEAMLKPVASLLDDADQLLHETNAVVSRKSTVGGSVDARSIEVPVDGDDCLLNTDDLLCYVNTARADFGEPPIRRNVFIARVEDELEGDHYKKVVVKNPNGTTSHSLMLTRDQCMIVSMRESKSVRRKVLQIIESLSTASPETEPAFSIPQTYAEALRLAAGQAEEIERQQVLIESAKPKVEFVDRYVEATGSKTFREVAKILDVTEKDFRAYLTEDKVCYRVNGCLMPYSDRISAGYCEVKTGERNGHAWAQVRFTPKGITWIASRIKKKRRTSSLRPRNDLFGM